MKKNILLLIALTILAFGCGREGGTADQPTDELAINALNNRINDAALRVDDFKRIKGTADASSPGVEAYKIQYQANIVAAVNLKSFSHSGLRGMDTLFVGDDDKAMNEKIDKDQKATIAYNKQRPGSGLSTYNFIKSYKAGEVIKASTGGLWFIKSKEGWVKSK